jgi:hypothetical protein
VAAAEPLRQYLHRIRDRIEPALESERARFAEWLLLVDLNLDPDRTPAEISGDVDAAFARASVSGMLALERLAAIKEATGRFSAVSLDEVARVRSLVESTSVPQSELVTRLASSRTTIPVITEVISLVTTELDSVERRIEERRQQFATKEEDPVALRSEVEGLLNTAKELLVFTDLPGSEALE